MSVIFAETLIFQIDLATAGGALTILGGAIVTASTAIAKIFSAHVRKSEEAWSALIKMSLDNLSQAQADAKAANAATATLARENHQTLLEIIKKFQSEE